MGHDIIRRKATFKDGFTAVGSVGLSGSVQVNTTMTFSAAPVFNVPVTAPTGSANYQVAGRLRINSGSTSATHSTTALNSGSILMVGAPILVGAPVASYNLVGELVVNTIAPSGSGGYFTVGFAASNAYGVHVDVNWFIINPA